jgi:hypothetical protein
MEPSRSILYHELHAQDLLAFDHHYELIIDQETRIHRKLGYCSPVILDMEFQSPFSFVKMLRVHYFHFIIFYLSSEIAEVCFSFLLLWHRQISR